MVAMVARRHLNVILLDINGKNFRIVPFSPFSPIVLLTFVAPFYSWVENMTLKKILFLNTQANQHCTQKADIHQIYYHLRTVWYQLAQMYTAFVAKAARGGARNRKVAGSIPNCANISCR